jgi:hypothetical protein
VIHAFTRKSGISSNPTEALPFNLDTTETISSSEIGGKKIAVHYFLY